MERKATKTVNGSRCNDPNTPRRRPVPPFIVEGLRMDLSKEGVLLAQEKVFSLLYENGYTAPKALIECATRAAIEAYLLEHKKTYSIPKMLPEVKKISEMKVYEVLWFEDNVTMPVWLTRIKTARRALACDARFSTHQENGRIRITRRENGSPNPGRDLFNNPRTVFLVECQIGVPVLAPKEIFPKRNYLERTVKTSARKIMDNFEANWRGWTSPEGVWIERIK